MKHIQVSDATVGRWARESAESQVISSPLSFTGSSVRIRRAMAGHWRHRWSNMLATAATAATLLVAWTLILCWYAVLICVPFMWIIVPAYRTFRRSQRRQRIVQAAQLAALQSIAARPNGR